MPPWEKGNTSFQSGFWANHGLIGPCRSVHLPLVQVLCNFPSIWPPYFRYHFVSFWFSKLAWSISSQLLVTSLYPRHSNIHCQLSPFYQMALHLHTDFQAPLNILGGHAIPDLSGARKEVFRSISELSIFGVIQNFICIGRTSMAKDTRLG